MYLSVIFPTYNEEKRIISTLNRSISFLKQQKFESEIIVVDDCSTDKTVEVIRKYKDIKIIENKKNMGKGFSVKRGILSSEGKYVLFSDADLSTPIEELNNFLKYIKEYDLVIASRNLSTSKRIYDNKSIRKLLGNIFPYIVRLLVVKGIYDTQCGFKIFRKNIANKLFSKQRINGFSFDVEILLLARKYNYQIKELPVVWKHVEGSKLSPIKDSFRMFIDILIIQFNNLFGYYKK